MENQSVTIEEKIVKFKSLAISNIVHSVLIKTVPNFTVEQLNIMKNNFIWQGEKTKNKTLHSV